jgi:sulfite reductase (ferredoxin)
MTARFVAERQGEESFSGFVKRIGKAECKRMVEDLMLVPSHDADPDFYQDWGDAREYTVGDLGQGECAGEIVSPAQFALTASEREVFEAQLVLERGEPSTAAQMAKDTMLHAAQALLLHRGLSNVKDPLEVLALFRQEFYDTELFYDAFTGGKFAHYFFDSFDTDVSAYNAEQSHHLIEEAQLFIEACHACYAKLLQNAVAATVKA